MRLEVIKLLMYVNRSFFSLMADWVPVINLRKNANVVLIPGVVYYPLLYHLKKKKKRNLFLSLCMRGLNLLIRCPGLCFQR